MFSLCHIRHLNPLKSHNERITLKDKELVKTLDYSGVTFPVSIKDMKTIERQNKIVLTSSDIQTKILILSESPLKNMRIISICY